MNIGFIGCGNMNTAIINGIVSSGLYDAKNIYAYNPSNAKIDSLVNTLSINKCNSSIDVCNNSELIVLGVKPNILESVLLEIKDSILDKTIVSIAAGKTLEFIESHIGNDKKVIRVMPNINANVLESCSAYCCNPNVDKSMNSTINKILESFGLSISIPETQFPLFGVMAGCSPAFVFMFIDALARAGVENGMKKDIALKIATQSVLGSAKNILNTDKHPYELVDQVCSPGGTTIEGVVSLQQTGFESSIHQAVKKSLEKDKKL